MKRRVILFTLVAVFACVTAGLAASPHLGIWKLNEAKSQLPPKAPKNTTVVYEAVGNSVKVTVDGVDGDGKPTHNEWTGKFDGKFYDLAGDPTADKRSYRKVNNNTLALSNQKNGKVTLTGKIVVSADGRTRTVTSTGTDATGKKITSTAVYDKQ